MAVYMKAVFTILTLFLLLLSFTPRQTLISVMGSPNNRGLNGSYHWFFWLGFVAILILPGMIWPDSASVFDYVTPLFLYAATLWMMPGVPYEGVRNGLRQAWFLYVVLTAAMFLAGRWSASMVAAVGLGFLLALAPIVRFYRHAEKYNQSKQV